ncbi:hypothetical protein [Tissierella creatinophila]|uniref:DUF3899 domain-containing protein n=1 Tax=Tissierella creatinophila DSM 6911 TaxID=1123403 RepID=A0A1U7M821_TISCR|nr:hypothetical protein [Tissierella creatinophila]OLS03462.1 hypothetical protein TICRE_05760 [Tissierella creatinophila DSM 6911]
MELKDKLRIFFVILSLCSYCIIFIGYRKLKKAVKELDKQRDTEIIKKETEEIIIRSGKLIALGSILGAIFGIIAMLFLHRII